MPPLRLSFALLPVLASCFAALAAAEVAVSGKIADENGLAVPSAKVEFRLSPEAAPSVVTSDIAGVFTVRFPAAGSYLIHAAKQGFFVFDGQTEFVDGPNQLQLTLNHLQDFFQSVDVAYSAPAIDPAQTSDQKQLTSVEILKAPYPSSQDLRNAFPLLPGVVQDINGRPHFNGGSSEQTNYTLDGFNIADPVTGHFEARLNIESVRSIDVESTRYSAGKDRGTAGSVDIKTNMGDDRWRFGATNFVPSVSTNGGLHTSKWTPRLTVSGPLVRGRAWFYNGFDTFYDVDTIDRLPDGENRTRAMTGSNITRLQVNVTPSNIVTGSLLLNRSTHDRRGLSFLDPVETTVNRREDLYFASVKDQIYFSNGALTEFGIGLSQGFVRERPQGDQTFEISPFGKSGNYFVNIHRHSGRQQFVSDTWLPAIHKFGEHRFRFGFDAQRTTFSLLSARHDYRLLREDLSVARYVSFLGNGYTRKAGLRLAEYVEDRWAPADGVLVEAGLRVSSDTIVGPVLLSPRLSVAYAPKWLRDTKFSAGIGIFFDALTLGLFGRQDQSSIATFFDPNGKVSRGPFETSFVVEPDELRAPRYRTLSFSVERKLPLDFYGKASYVGRAGRRGFTFAPDQDRVFAPIPEGGLYRLRNWRNDRYDAVELSARRTFAGKFEWVGSYTRSSARTDAVVDYSLENPIFAPQSPGRLPWDAPDRFMTWGWAPVPRSLLPRPLRSLINQTEVAYLMEYRTGFPFGVVNEEGVMVGRPNDHRLPSYFNMNLHFERRFRFLNYQWAWRFGINNLTNSGNPNVVDNNVSSPTFLTYGRGQLRAVNVRLRFLGRR